MPATESPRPSSKRISVAEGRKEQIRIEDNLPLGTDRLQSSARSGRENIGKDKPFAFHDLANLDGNRPSEHGTLVGARGELFILAARIDAGGKVREQALVKGASGESAIELF